METSLNHELSQIEIEKIRHELSPSVIEFLQHMEDMPELVDKAIYFGPHLSYYKSYRKKSSIIYRCKEFCKRVMEKF